MNWRWIAASFWPLVVGHYAARGIAFASAILLARSVPPAQLAPYLAIVGVVIVVTAASNWGSDTLGIRDIATRGGLARELLGRIIVVRAGICILGSVALAVFLRIGGAPLSYLLPLSVALLAFASRADWVLLADGKGRAAGLAMVGREVVFLVAATVVLAGAGPTHTWALLWCFAAAETAWSVATLLAVRAIAAPVAERNLPRVAGLLRDGVPLAAVSIMGAIQNKADIPLLSMFRPPEEVASYWAAYTIVFAISAVPSVLANSSLAEFTRDAANGTGKNKDAWRIAIIAGAVAGVLAVAVAMLASPILRVAYGAHMAGGAEALKILCLALPLKAMSVLLGARLVAEGKLVRWGGAFVVAGVVNVTANLLVIPQYGQIGAAWTTVASEALLLGGVLTAIGMREGVKGYGRIVALAAVMAIVAAIFAARVVSVPRGAVITGAVVCAVIAALMLSRAGKRRVATP